MREGTNGFEGKGRRLESRARKVRAVPAVLLAALLLAAPALAETETEPEPEPKSAWSSIGDGVAAGFDVLVLRPLNFSRMVIGFGAFIPAAMFAEVAPIFGGDAARWKAAELEIWELFVYEAAEATFIEPLGSFREYDY
jgi:hypothetical protein